MISFDLDDFQTDLPDLGTVVGLYGHSAREDVVGPACLATILGTIVSQ
ncbi:MAG TPA: hypothetical protein VF552_14985 [Allosphingosinicella sp.]|jgi:hypothetical protein